MPVPGPRNQFGPLPGYDNPNGEKPTRINHWNAPSPIAWPGESPGLTEISLRGCVLAYGTIRKLWRQSVNYIPAAAAYSWTANGPAQSDTHGFQITRALRYMTRSVYVGAGIDNTRFDEMHTKIVNGVDYKTVTIGAGNVRNRPTVRNRMTSFGSRVPTLNQVSPAAEPTNNG